MKRNGIDAGGMRKKRQVRGGWLLAAAIVLGSAGIALAQRRNALWPFFPASLQGIPLITWWWPVWALLTLSMVSLSAAAFILRLHARGTYGAIEVAVGVGVVLLAAVAYTEKLVSGVGNAGFTYLYALNGILQFAAGVYVIVRGLDSIDQEIKKHSSTGWWKERWRRAFLIGV